MILWQKVAFYILEEYFHIWKYPEYTDLEKKIFHFHNWNFDQTSMLWKKLQLKAEHFLDAYHPPAFIAEK